MNHVLRVGIVDDHELTRAALKLALLQDSSLEVIFSATNGNEAIEMVKEHDPDVIIIDLQMPSLDGLSASTQIKTLNSKTKIIIYSSVEDPQVEVMVQTAPVDAFCPKNAPTETLVSLIKELGKTQD
ncbi:response regulator receiver protein [Crinalium epipsammum PCC 9333]|uniref:Response regulator receiver protein n=1 Tax=Crinalium epipsammum PCC 9333 TaxID=1173022 RepID=K9VVW8_9CYAN|nr:response regulator transcription factor [Crinalium epipsammum]AFZ11709.1 response regulator receiver protein [Crinalium epipsammum PCC 9333]